MLLTDLLDKFDYGQQIILVTNFNNKIYEGNVGKLFDTEFKCCKSNEYYNYENFNVLKCFIINDNKLKLIIG